MKNKTFAVLTIVLAVNIGVGFSQQTSNGVLAPGNPPLTQAMVNDLNSFFEWVFEISLTPEQRNLVKTSTISSWNRKDKDEIGGTLEILDLQTRLSQAIAEARIATREKMQPEMLKTLENSGDEMSVMLLAAYRSAHNKQAGSHDSLPIPGEPPLTREIVDKSVRLFEWLFDAKFTQEQYKDHEDSLIATWRANNRTAMTSTLDVLTIHAELGKKTQAERDAVREAFCAQYLEKMRQSPDLREAQWALGIYYSAHTPIAKGNPPLTRQAADAYAEVMSFMINEVLGGEVLRADKEYKNKLAASLAAQYPGLTPARQKEFSQMPIAWAGIRMTWPTLSESQKAKYRQQWAPGIRALLPPEPKPAVTQAATKSPKTPSAAPVKSSSSARQIIADYNAHQKTRQWLFNLNQDFIHEHILSPGWTYQKYSTW